MKNAILLICLIITIPLLAAWRDFFPKTEEIFVRQCRPTAIDFTMDKSGRLFVLSEGEDSVFVEIFSPEGKSKLTIGGALGPTPAPETYEIQISENGEIIVVRGMDSSLDSPINWVFDGGGREILPGDNVLKYAEWLRVSPGGNYFSCQGYASRKSIINNIFNRDFEPILTERDVIHGYFIGLAGEQELVLLLERENENYYLCLLELPSEKEHFRTTLDPKLKRVVPHEGITAILDDYFVFLTYACKSSTVYAFSRQSGELVWENQMAFPVDYIGASIDRNSVGLKSFLCTGVLTPNGKEIFSHCESPLDADLSLGMSFRPRFTLWGERRILTTAYYLYDQQEKFKTVIVPFGEGEKEIFPVQLPYLIGGFRVEGRDYVVVLKDNEVGVYQIVR